VNIFYFATDLPVIRTNGEYEFHANNNVRLPNQKSSWRVTVSVNAEYDASIVLCEGEDPFKSACYWIILGGWRLSGGMSVIRRCPDGVNSKGYPNEPCYTAVAADYVCIIFGVHLNF
jgi:hypothetical protein